MLKPSTLLILNTAVTYGRSLFAVGLALFSSRWLLLALGVVDFGLFSLVGSVLMFVTYLNSVLAGSSSRHFAYAIGRGDPNEVKIWFNTALSLHLCMAVVLAGIGWFAGESIITQALHIPVDRVDTCLAVYHISLVSLFSGMVSVPFLAMFNAKQQIVETSAWNMLLTVLSFTLAWYLLSASGDKLRIYAFGMTTILFFIHIGQITRAFVRFQECRLSFRHWFDSNRIKELFSFAFWNLIGSSGSIFRNEGSAILLNLYFGPTVNAAYGIAKRVAEQTDQLAASMINAFSPEITVREGRGDRDSMIKLALQASKFGALLVLVFLVPLMLEMEYVLSAWLVNPPQYAVSFCRLILGAFLLDRLTTGFMIAFNAQGRIAAYQGTVGTMLLFTLPLAWVFLSQGLPPTSVGVAFVVTMALVSTGRILWARRLLQVPVTRWVQTVFYPCLMVGCFSTAFALLPLLLVPPSFLRLLLVTGASLIMYLLCTWFIALDQQERLFFYDAIKKVRKRVINQCAGHL